MPTLREARIGELLSIRALAERAGVSPHTVFLVETGQRRPRFGTMRKLAGALGAEPVAIVEFQSVIEEARRGRRGASRLRRNDEEVGR